MSASRTKTQKRSASVTDVSGETLFASQMSNSQTNFMTFLSREADEAYNRPWHRLERGLRLNRLRQFAENEAKRLTLSDAEKDELIQHLIRALDKKLLTSKNNVLYDPDSRQIQEVKNLVMHRNAEGRLLFQILEKRGAVTFRKKPVAAAATAATADTAAAPVTAADDASPL